MEGWPAGSQPRAPAHASEVGVSVHPVFAQLPGSAGYRPVIAGGGGVQACGETGVLPAPS